MIGIWAAEGSERKKILKTRRWSRITKGDVQREPVGSVRALY